MAAQGLVRTLAWMAIASLLLTAKGNILLEGGEGAVEDDEELPDTFGSAKKFHPLPGTTVGAHCTWEVVLNTVYNRIPQTITEILCHGPNKVCGGNSAYQCRQIRSRMLVGYTEGNNVVKLRNNTVSIGCSCLKRNSLRLEQFLRPISEKRSLVTKGRI